jgi:hypothetical protein
MTKAGSISVRDHLNEFRECLDALSPVMTRHDIPWRDGEAYDDWDRIAETLFDVLVVGPSRLALAEANLDGVLPIPAYGFSYASYEAHSWFDFGGEGEHLAFQEFVADDGFEVVRAVRVDASGRVLDPAVLLEWPSAENVCWERRFADGRSERVESLVYLL